MNALHLNMAQHFTYDRPKLAYTIATGRSSTHRTSPDNADEQWIEYGFIMFLVCLVLKVTKGAKNHVEDWRTVCKLKCGPYISIDYLPRMI